jgi:hypothetical protein
MQLDPKWNFIAGLAVQYAELTSNNISKDKFLEQSFTNLFPTFVLQYRKPRSKNFRFSYRGATQQPNINQLQDVIDNSNVLHVRSGNPSLKQEFNNNLNLYYNTFNPATFSSFTVSMNGSSTLNRIGNSITINTTQDSVMVDGYKLGPGAQFSKPQNIDGGLSVGGNINYGFRLKNPKANINLTSRFNYNREVNLVNDTKAFTHNYVIGGSVRYNMNLNEAFDLNFFSNSTYNIVNYTTGTREDNNYFTQRFSIEPTWTTKSGWILSNDFDYVMNRGNASGYNQSIPLWNAGLAKMFLKKRQAELRLTVFDILNENRAISRNVEQNYIEDVRSEVLNRYFLLSFTYHIKKFKGPQSAPGTNRRRQQSGQ